MHPKAASANRLLGTERNAPPHFAGRAEELSKLSAYAEYIFQNADPSGGIALIDGVPGSGKTQLMRQFVERQQAGGNGVLTLAATTADIPADAKSQRFLNAALAHGNEMRSQYYEARLSAMRTPKGIAHFLAGAMDDGGAEQAMYLHEVVNALEELPAASNPEGLPPMEIIDAAVEAGVLVEQAGRYSFGIPSFHQHALAAYRRMTGSESA